MNYRPQSQFRAAAFTLVELLTVITIIAILMGLLFPAIGIAKDQARKAEARQGVLSIVTAVKAYYTEYGKYPPPQQTGTTGDIIYGDPASQATSSNAWIFNILRNVPDGTGGPSANSNNPRAINFFDGKSVADPNNPKSGFASQTGATAAGVAYSKGAYFDPWGHEYCIAIDADYDNTINNLPYIDFQPGGQVGPPMTGVAVFSLGKDGKLGTNGDNYYRNPAKTTPADDIISWQ